MRVLIVPDKFKGSLTAKQAAKAIVRGWSSARRGDPAELLPMSDGGDGFGEVMGGLLNAEKRPTRTVNAAHRPIRASWWWEPTTRTAIVESAKVIGLARLGSHRPHPFDLDTFGLGRLLESVAQLKPRRCFIGVGGSATNDGGFGAARALGWRFFNRNGSEITRWPNLIECCKIVAPKQRLKLGRLSVALDVRNPLLGPHGCTRVYGPQKGMRPQDFKTAEAALRQVSQLIDRYNKTTLAREHGAGAAGGLGFGLMAFLNARPVMGFTLFEQEAKLKRRLRTTDLVITGEGCLDRQSLMGKGVGALLELCESARVPCLALCGQADISSSAQKRFAGVRALTSITSKTASMTQARKWLTETARLAAGEG